MSITATKNAVIKSTYLGGEDHGIFTAYLNLDYAGAGQAFGGYALDKHDGNRSAKGKRLGTAYGMEFIRRVVETIGVANWEKLPGERIRVRATSQKVEAIGHFLEDRWFCPEADLKEFVPAS